jgi:quercetin 2,3-dioxygenase
MIATRRSADRCHFKRGKLDVWSTFGVDEGPDPLSQAFWGRLAFEEMRLPPGGVCTPRRRGEAEIVTYVFRGAHAQENSNGCSAVMHAGEFHRMTAGREVRHKEANASQADWAHVFRISFPSSEVAHDDGYDQKRFLAAERRNALCVVASPDGRDGSLRVHRDVLILSSILDVGHHVFHELRPGRSAWLHVLCGEAMLQDIVLLQGDGASVALEPSVSLTVQESTEILLVDLGPAPDAPSSGVAR